VRIAGEAVRDGGEEVKGRRRSLARSAPGVLKATRCRRVPQRQRRHRAGTVRSRKSPHTGYRYWDFRVAFISTGRTAGRFLRRGQATDFEAAETESARLRSPLRSGGWPRRGVPGPGPDGHPPSRGHRRAQLAALFFRLRGGIAARFAPFWPAALLAIPLLA